MRLSRARGPKKVASCPDSSLANGPWVPGPDKDELELLHEGVSAGCAATGYFYRLSVRLVENLMRESRTKRDPSQFICNADFA